MMQCKPTTRKHACYLTTEHCGLISFFLGYQTMCKFWTKTVLHLCERSVRGCVTEPELLNASPIDDDDDGDTTREPGVSVASRVYTSLGSENVPRKMRITVHTTACPS
jgi:hypothetical protein